MSLQLMQCLSDYAAFIPRISNFKTTSSCYTTTVLMCRVIYLYDKPAHSLVKVKIIPEFQVCIYVLI